MQDCGFCPNHEKFSCYPKPMPKYDRDNPEQQVSDITGDKCPDLGVKITPVSKFSCLV